VIATTRLPDTAAEFGADAEVRQLVAAIFGSAAATQAAAPRISASSTWTGGGHDPALAIDGAHGTRWNAADRSRGAQWLEVDFGQPVTVTATEVAEAFDRVRGYRIQTWDGAAWVDQATGDRLGTQREDRFAAVSTTKVRLLMEAVASDSASIAEWTIRGADGRNLLRREAAPCHRNPNGGRAWFLPSPQADALRAVLAEALPDGDLVFERDPAPTGGNLSYIHKVKEGKDIYFIGNSSDQPVDGWVRLAGGLVPELWNPHDGSIRPAEYQQVPANNGTATRVRLQLAPVQSVFIVADHPAKPAGPR
jgi:hypothetical protein